VTTLRQRPITGRIFATSDGSRMESDVDFLRALRISEKGQAIVEFAVMLPIFVLIAMGLIDLQWMLKDAADIDYIVTESARCEASQLAICAAPNSAQGYALSMASSLRLDTATMQLTTPPCVQICSVSIAYPYKALGAWFPALTIRRTGMAAVTPPPGS